MFELDYKDFGFNKSNAYFLANCSSIVYSPGDQIRKYFELFSPYKSEVKYYNKCGTEAFLLITSKYAVLSFAGTNITSIEDIKTDINTMFVLEGNGYAHCGFVKGIDLVWKDILKDIFSLRVPLFITGHSLGAALATLAISRLNARGLFCTCYTFGSPRVGDHNFAASVDTNSIFRVVNNNDMITDLPPYLAGFRHCGVFVYLTDDGVALREPSWWRVKKENWKGIVKDIGEIGLDSVKDHYVRNYILNLRRCLSEKTL